VFRDRLLILSDKSVCSIHRLEDYDDVKSDDDKNHCNERNENDDKVLNNDANNAGGDEVHGTLYGQTNDIRGKLRQVLIEEGTIVIIHNILMKTVIIRLLFLMKELQRQMKICLLVKCSMASHNIGHHQ
jgi:hypothetical protein